MQIPKVFLGHADIYFAKHHNGQEMTK